MTFVSRGGAFQSDRHGRACAEPAYWLWRRIGVGWLTRTTKNSDRRYQMLCLTAGSVS